MSGKRNAIINIAMSSDKLAEMVFRALNPEVDARVQIAINDNVVTLYINTKTTAMMRAVANSYLRWIALINQVSTSVR